MAKKKKPTLRHAEVVTRFAARLRELRSSRGMTQAELALQAKTTAAYIWRLESGQSAPGIDLVDKLATALGTTLSDLVPEGAIQDTEEVLRRQARQLFERLLEQADRETLLMLNPLLSRLL